MILQKKKACILKKALVGFPYDDVSENKNFKNY